MRNTFTKPIPAAILAATLAACGGGGGDAGGGPVAGSITLTGTVAKQQALAGASVSARCASGTGSTTAGADGTYTMTITGNLPCALKASSGADVYHSVQYGTAPTGSFPTNVSLLTELMVAKLSGQSPETYYMAFGSGSSVTRTMFEDTLPYLSSALSLDLTLANINILTAVYGSNSPIELKSGELVSRMNAKGVTAAQLDAAIVANPNNAAAVAALLN